MSEIADALTVLVADAFALYVKTRNLQLQMPGPPVPQFDRDMDSRLDQELDDSFPASDPPSLTQPRDR